MAACPSNADGVGADELGLGLGLGVFVLEDEGDDFDKIVVQLVEGVGMGVSAQEGWDVADILPGDALSANITETPATFRISVGRWR